MTYKNPYQMKGFVERHFGTVNISQIRAEGFYGRFSGDPVFYVTVSNTTCHSVSGGARLVECVLDANASDDECYVAMYNFVARALNEGRSFSGLNVTVDDLRKFEGSVLAP